MDRSADINRDAQLYCRLQLIWSFISIAAPIAMTAGLVVACRVLLDGDNPVDMPRLILIWAGWLALFLIVDIAIYYHLTYRLPKQFGLTNRPSWPILRELARNAMRSICWRIILITLAMEGRSVIGLVWMVVALVGVVSVVILAFSRKQRPSRVLGFDVIDPGPSESIEALKAFANRQGIEDLDVELLGASELGDETTAAYHRFGDRHIIYLADNLIKIMNADELTAIFAHELGHSLRSQSLLRRLGSETAMLAGLCLAVEISLIGAANSFSAQVASGAIALMLTYILHIAARPVVVYLSRREEIRAHLFAVEMTGDGEALISALTKLAGNNLVAGKPGLLSKLFFQTHPSLDEVADMVVQNENHRDHREHRGHEERP